MARNLQSLIARRNEILDRMDRIIESGGRVPANDPLMASYRDVNRKIRALGKKG